MAFPPEIPEWETDEELRDAARWALLYDARIYNEALTAARITVPGGKGDDEVMTTILQGIATAAAAVALLIHMESDRP